MKNLRKIILFIVLFLMVLSIGFSVVASVSITKKVGEIVLSSSHSNGKDFEKYSEYISEEDYKTFDHSYSESKEDYKIESGLLVVVLPHNLIFGKHVEGLTDVYFEDWWIGSYYKFDIEFKGFSYRIKNVDFDGAGCG